MNDDKMITQNDIDAASVRLRPILGMPPKQYLLLLYGAASIALLFLIFVYPGLKNPGMLWSFIVDPPGSAVYIDGAYRGSAPCTIFVNTGNHALTITRPGFTDYTESISMQGRIFGTLIIKPKVQRAISLAPVTGSSILEDGIHRFATWALSGSPSEAYQVPMVLSDAARAASISPHYLDSKRLAGAAASYSLHSQSLRDGIRAVAISYSRSATLTPSTLWRLVSELSLEVHDDPSILSVLADLGPKSIKLKLESIPAFKVKLAGEATPTKSLPIRTGAKTTVLGQEFVLLQGGIAIIKAGSSASAVVTVHPFSLAISETTTGQFRRFIEKHPEWAPESVATLVSKGLAQDDYLQGFIETQAGAVLTYVPRTAAIAYCEWLTESAPQGYRFVLPTEAQWSYAAAMSDSTAGKNALFSDLGASGPLSPDALPADSAGFKGLLGNVWEWCADSYASNPAIGRVGRERFSSYESVVRGGSWANRSDLVSLDARGPMQESDCSAYVGFRVALITETE